MRNPDKLLEILDLVEDVIRCDSDRNFGDRDVYIKKLHFKYNEFSNEDSSERTPLEYFKDEVNNYFL